MNRTIRAITGIIFVLVIAFSAISICQNTGGRIKIDATEQKLYTLSDGSKAILGKLNQPIKLKLYYARTAAMKAPDQIKYFNNYYEYVKALLEEYVAAAKGMVALEIIDPRPFSDDEVEASRHGLRRFPITEEEAFCFGLVVQTQFGVEKSIPFFSPDRQNFVEYDISDLIDSAVTRQKQRIGVLSSLPVMGQDVSGYMAQMMRMQGQQPEPPWTIIEHLRQQYEAQSVPADTEDINDVDILLVIHPKDLPEKTLFAIDQFILKGGRTIICVDPHCFADTPNPAMSPMGTQSQGSQLDRLLRTWGLEIPQNTFAGDRQMALRAALTASSRPETVIGFLNLTPPENFNPDSVITAELNSVRVLFAGVLNETLPAADANSGTPGDIERIPLLTTTNRGNSFTISSPFEITMMDAGQLMAKFIDGTEPVVMGYMLTGRFKSTFPDGIELDAESSEDANDAEPKTRHITGLSEASEDCAVIVFSDVDFISDMMAYQNTIFGKTVVADNSSLLMNAIDELSGSNELISIRSRGNFRRPFTVVDEIEAEAEAETAEEVAKLNTEIDRFESELRQLLTSTKEEERQIIGSSIVQRTRELELQKLKARQQLREVRVKRRERIEHLGNWLRAFNMLMAPAVILMFAIVLGIRRSVTKRHYISHASDA